MTKRLKFTKPRTAIVRSTSRTARVVDPTSIAGPLGAERFSIDADTGVSPPAFPALRSMLFAALRSSGGRPALEGAERRQKIPMSDADWHELEKIAQSLQASGVNATPGQIAGQLLRDAIAHIESKTYPLPPAPMVARVSEDTNSSNRAASSTEPRSNHPKTRRRPPKAR